MLNGLPVPAPRFDVGRLLFQLKNQLAPNHLSFFLFFLFGS
ncbi:MAG: hypothetical protein ACI81O_001393 [Cyclobacteriaceae bacterium]|jgi:hypothetical protein